MFITFEGIDGSGKSTQIRSLALYLEERGYNFVLTREPGGSPGAEEIRALVLQGDTDRWSAEVELLLFNAARRDHIERTIQPALNAGKIVLCDRFVDSTRALQVAGNEDLSEKVELLHESMIGLMPSLTLVFDLDPEIALARNQALTHDEDRFENKGLEYHQRVRQKYLDIVSNEPRRCKRIDASGDLLEVFDRVVETVLPRL